MGTDIAVIFGLSRPVREASDYRFLGAVRATLRNLRKEFGWVTQFGVIMAEGGVDALISALANELAIHYDVPRSLSRDTATRMLWMVPQDRREPPALAAFLGHALAQPKYVFEAFTRVLRERGLDQFAEAVVMELFEERSGGQPITVEELDAVVRRRFEERYGSAMKALRVTVRQNDELPAGTAHIHSVVVV